MTAALDAARALPAVSLDRKLRIVMADDDRNDQMLMVMATDEARAPIELSFVDDGAELLNRLSMIGTLDDLPDAIVLDLRMPRLDGHRTLDRLQAHPVLWQIPVVVFSTSHRYVDIRLSHDLGARDFETKPDSFSGMIDFVTRLAVIVAQRQPYEDPAGALGDPRCQRALLGPDLVSDMDDLLLEDLDLLDPII
ncbi:MAG: response regulator [Actinomycetota bacterium]